MSGCVIFLIDESQEMKAPVARPTQLVPASEKPMAESVGNAINSLLNKLIRFSDFEIALVGYRSDGGDDTDVGCRWAGALAERDFVPAGQLADAPVRMEERVRRIAGQTGMQEQTIEFPVWYEPQLGVKSPQVAAFAHCRDLLIRWTGSGSPLIVNICGGPSSDGNPQGVIGELLQMEFNGEPPVVMQAHLASETQRGALTSTVFPANRAYLTAGSMRDMFDRSSVLPASFLSVLQHAAVTVNDKARALIYNANMVDLSRMLSLVQAHAEQGSTGTATKDDKTEEAADEEKQQQDICEESDDAEDLGKGDTFEEETPYGADEALHVEESDEIEPDDDRAMDVGDDEHMEVVDDASDEGFDDSGSGDAETEPAVATSQFGPVSPEQPALVVFVLDRSVDDPFGGDLQNCCARLQEHLGELVAKTAKIGGGAIDVGVVSYGMDGIGEAEVRTTLDGGLAGQTFVRDNELEVGAVHVEEWEEERDNGTGTIITIPRKRLQLIEIEPTSAAPPTGAFAELAELISMWTKDNPTSAVPPIVVHLTRGKLDGAELADAVTQVQSTGNSAGSTVVYHLVVTEGDHRPLKYPNSSGDFEDADLAKLWELSSVLLDGEQIARERADVVPDSRGIVINAGFDLLLDPIRKAMVGSDN